MTGPSDDVSHRWAASIIWPCIIWWHMTVVWQRMVLTAIHWGYKPSIPDQSQSENLVLFIFMIVCTMTNAHWEHPMTKDPMRVTKLPAESNRSNWRRRWGQTCPIRKEIPDSDKDRAARRKPYLGLASSAAIVPGQRDKEGIYTVQVPMYLPHTIALPALLVLDNHMYCLF